MLGTPSISTALLQAPGWNGVCLVGFHALCWG